MEFPLFPVFLRAAVQTPPVPWGWAGLGKSACLPITHLAALEREQSTQTYGMLGFHGEERPKSVCSALLRSRSRAYFLWSFSVRNKHAGIFTNGRPIKYHQDCLLYFSVIWSLVCKWGWQYAGGPFSACSACLLHFSVCTFGFTLLVHCFQTSVIVWFLPSAQVWRWNCMCKATFHSHKNHGHS